MRTRESPKPDDPVPAVSCAEMREIDRRASEEFGIPAATLMENAGRRGAEEALRLLGSGHKGCVAVLCGGGNNGGDGFVAARILAEDGRDVRVVLLKPAASLREPAASNFDRMKNAGVPFVERPDPAALRGLVAGADLVIDALLGTGFAGEAKPLFREAIECANASGKPILALEVPSGLDADRGLAQGPCIRARRTLTMGALKKSFLNPASREWTGEVVVADIGFPKRIFENFKQPKGGVR